jgi:hypothetical protein
VRAAIDQTRLFASFGARGLNSGIADVENAAWKLAYVLDGHASEALLETYNTVRPPRGSSPVPAPGTLVPGVATPAGRLRALARSGFLLLTDLALPSARGVAVLPVRFPSDPAEALGAKPGEIWIVRPDARVAAVLSTPDDLPAPLRRSCGW